MPAQQLAGSRIREKRLDRGLKQAVVAEIVGISPSYLNLIEHNRRRIGGKILADIARALDVDASLLIDGVDAALLDEMRHAAALLGPDVEVEKAEECAARYPGWSALIATQSRRITALQTQVQALSDRMTHDPALAAALHEVISTVSAIRSSSSILVGPEHLDDDWQRRFHHNIHDDSLRLAESSEALISYLQAPEAQSDTAMSAFEQMESWLAQSGFHLPALEKGGADTGAFVKASGLTGASAALLKAHAEVYAEDAVALPLAKFEKACRAHAYDPAAIAQHFFQPLPRVLRRLACLPPEAGHPPMALAVCDAAGVLTFVKPVPGFSMPRAGGACPLWPLFLALNRPGQPIRLEVALPGVNASHALCYAVATVRDATHFDVPPAVQSIMLVVPDPETNLGAPQPVGVACRICPRSDCASRREPAVSGVSVQTAL
ncbi:short-chain fatty acyl-CoA regulator family protein [Loktanella sp. Alg231-35]|uniref:short-chain fatty acyl-CoA regulator family protein n=1 Tax=Loktanella sp. Alg231-35 TaxID=1922220 RepID=UPI000D54F2C6|nr:short-chain fatty acyl-CoA regulator family protein [Loktanella sp. Alg231-35]